MRCEDCAVREATQTHTIHRARGVADTYRLCRWCYGEAIGVPYVVQAPALTAPPCVACGGPGGTVAGLCQPCVGALRATVRHAKRGGVPGVQSRGAVAALAVDLHRCVKWNTYADLVTLRLTLLGRLAAK